MDKEENRNWADRFKNRDMHALGEAIDVLGPSVQSLVRRVLSGAGSAEDVEECVSDVFLAAWHNIASYDESRASFRTWLFILAKYKALDLRRKLLRPEEISIALPDVGDERIIDVPAEVSGFPVRFTRISRTGETAVTLDVDL